MSMQSAIIPCLTYQNAPAAIDFLCRAFGFARHAVHASEDGRHVHHAQLLRQGSMVMLSSASADGMSRFNTVSPMRTQGATTIGLYVVLDAVDSHHAIAAAAGAVIIAPPHDNDYGGRSYEARDCEGNFWSFGSYDPLG